MPLGAVPVISPPYTIEPSMNTASKRTYGRRSSLAASAMMAVRSSVVQMMRSGVASGGNEAAVASATSALHAALWAPRAAFWHALLQYETDLHLPQRRVVDVPHCAQARASVRPSGCGGSGSGSMSAAAAGAAAACDGAADEDEVAADAAAACAGGTKPGAVAGARPSPSPCAPPALPTLAALTSTRSTGMLNESSSAPYLTRSAGRT